MAARARAPLHGDPHAVPQSHAIAGSAAPADKMDAVVRAVEAQLITDGRRPPHDPDGKMGDDYHYVEPTMRGFLLAIAARLVLAGYRFNPLDVDPNGALGMTLRDLIEAIFNATQP